MCNGHDLRSNEKIMAIKRIVLNHPYPPEEAAANVEKQLCMRGSNTEDVLLEYTHNVPLCPQCVLVCSRECNGTS